jgi:hypothetical protein
MLHRVRVGRRGLCGKGKGNWRTDRLAPRNTGMDLGWGGLHAPGDSSSGSSRYVGESAGPAIGPALAFPPGKTSSWSRRRIPGTMRGWPRQPEARSTEPGEGERHDGSIIDFVLGTFLVGCMHPTASTRRPVTGLRRRRQVLHGCRPLSGLRDLRVAAVWLPATGEPVGTDRDRGSPLGQGPLRAAPRCPPPHGVAAESPDPVQYR